LVSLKFCYSLSDLFKGIGLDWFIVYVLLEIATIFLAFVFPLSLNGVILVDEAGLMEWVLIFLNFGAVIFSFDIPADEAEFKFEFIMAFLIFVRFLHAPVSDSLNRRVVAVSLRYIASHGLVGLAVVLNLYSNSL
jgi:hypothetical protein